MLKKNAVFMRLVAFRKRLFFLFIDKEVEHEKEKGTFIVSNDTDYRPCVF